MPVASQVVRFVSELEAALGGTSAAVLIRRPPDNHALLTRILAGWSNRARQPWVFASVDLSSAELLMATVRAGAQHLIAAAGPRVGSATRAALGAASCTSELVRSLGVLVRDLRPELGLLVLTGKVPSGATPTSHPWIFEALEQASPRTRWLLACDERWALPQSFVGTRPVWIVPRLRPTEAARQICELCAGSDRSVLLYEGPASASDWVASQLRAPFEVRRATVAPGAPALLSQVRDQICHGANSADPAVDLERAGDPSALVILATVTRLSGTVDWEWLSSSLDEWGWSIHSQRVKLIAFVPRVPAPMTELLGAPTIVPLPSPRRRPTSLSFRLDVDGIVAGLHERLRQGQLPPRERALYEVSLAAHQSLQASPSMALGTVESALRSAKEANDISLSAQVMYAAGPILARVGQLEMGAELLRAAALLARQLGQGDLEIACAQRAGDIAYNDGEWSRAVAEYERAATLAIDRPAELCRARAWQGEALRRLGSEETAAVLWRDTLEREDAPETLRADIRARAADLYESVGLREQATALRRAASDAGHDGRPLHQPLR